MGGRRSDGPTPSDISPLVPEVKENLDRDLSLENLARSSGTPPARFRRQFSRIVGETPRRHVERLRLERAAYRLAVTDAKVIDIALAVGFESHEVFSRAFRRWSGFSPNAYRQAARVTQAQRVERNRYFQGQGCSLGEVWFEAHKPTSMLAVHVIGEYARLNAPEAREPIWRELQAWAKSHAVRLTDNRWGLFPDDPTLTPGELQGADLCIPIGSQVQGDRRVRCIELAGGLYGKISHLGPGPTVIQAYRHLADGIRRAGYVFREDPPVQVFFEMDAERHEIWFPIRRR
jgi:AraC family transcriptional regulator